MYSICTKSGEIVETYSDIEKARKAIEGNGHLHIRYSQQALELENRRREHIAKAMPKKKAMPVFLSGSSEVVEVAAKMAPLYEKHIRTHFEYQRGKSGEDFISEKPAAFFGA